MIGVEEKGRQAIELARTQLDFAAMADAAPSAKDILYKAQTIVPKAPAKPWWKAGAGTGAAMVIAAAIFLPWIPASLSLSMLTYAYDQQMTDSEAHELASGIQRNLEPGILLSSGLAADQTGGRQLALKVSAFDTGTDDLQVQMDEVFTAAAQAPLVPAARESIKVNSHKSPWQYAVGAFSTEQEDQELNSPTGEIEETILAHERVILEGLRLKLESKGVVKGFCFSEKTGGLPTGYDFRIPCWPMDATIAIEPDAGSYQELLPFEQEEIRVLAREFLTDANLIMETDEFLKAIKTPIFVEVYAGGGTYNQHLSRQLNSYIKQPLEDEYLTDVFKPNQSIEDAVDIVLGGYDCRIDIHPAIGKKDLSQGAIYRARVTVIGEKEPAQDSGLLNMLPDDGDYEY